VGNVRRFQEIVLRRVLLFRMLVILATIVFLSGVTFVVLAKNEKGVQHPYNQTVGLRKIYYNVLQRVGPLGTGLCACQPDRVETMVLQERFETRVSIYDHGGSGLRPGIVLIHGNVWMGQQMSTYRLVAHGLAREGFIVLTFDKIGFGASDDPFGLGPSAVAAAYDTVSQVDEAVDYLLEHTDVDHANITLLGHSGGVTQALELGQASDRIANVAIWVAPWGQPTESEVSANLAYLGNKFIARYNLIYGRGIPEWFSWELTRIEDKDPELIWEYFRTENHKPLILILGENDQPEKHPSVLATFESLAEPKELLFIPGADHYLNSAQSLRWVFYDRASANALIGSLAQSLSGVPESR
jgi:uncharacterized protein